MKILGIILYLLIQLLIGAIASRRMKDLRDYYAGGMAPTVDALRQQNPLLHSFWGPDGVD